MFVFWFLDILVIKMIFIHLPHARKLIGVIKSIQKNVNNIKVAHKIEIISRSLFLFGWHMYICRYISVSIIGGFTITLTSYLLDFLNNPIVK